MWLLLFSPPNLSIALQYAPHIIAFVPLMLLDKYFDVSILYQNRKLPETDQVTLKDYFFKMINILTLILLIKWDSGTFNTSIWIINILVLTYWSFETTVLG